MSTLRVNTLRADTLAALTVALVGIPQCLAYAMIAGLPPAYGLATAAVPGFIAALAGRSAKVTTGPTNTTCLLILVALAPFFGESGMLPESALGVLATLTLLAGLIRLVAAFVGGAALIEFLPESVLAGFTAGAGVLIAAMQLDETLGLVAIRGGSLPDELRAVGGAIAGAQLPAIAIALATIAMIALGRAFAPRWPMTLLAVVAATAGAYALGFDHSAGLPLIGDRAPIPAGWPPGALPSVELPVIRALLAPAAALALLGTLELAVAARHGGARPDIRRELLGQGAANTAGAFTSAFPASASLTRSVLMVMSGGRTRLAPALAALFVVPVLLFGGPLVAAIPQASLAGVLIWTAFQMVAGQPLGRIWVVSPVTRSILLATFVATLVLPLELAILGGAALGAVIHLATTNRPRLQLLAPRGDRLVAIAPPGTDGQEGEPIPVVVLEVSGDMHYAAAKRFRAEARALIANGTRHVVLDLTHARAMLFSALIALEELAAFVRERGGALHLAGVDPEFAQILERTGSELPYTGYDPEPLASVRACLDGLADDRDEEE